MKRTFLLLYLDTGGGHKAPAAVLRSALLEQYPDASVELFNGFSPYNYPYHLMVERGYHTACNYAPGAFSLLYEVARFRPVQKIFDKNFKLVAIPYLKREFKRRGVTDVVSFHFFLNPGALKAIRLLGGTIRFSCVVTDPFTAPPVWFYEHGIRYYVYTEQVKQTAVSCGVPEENIEICPFLINKKFTAESSAQDAAAYRQKHGLPIHKRILLLAGGGEGLPGAIKLAAYYVKHAYDFAVAIVCGRDKYSKHCLELLKAANPQADLHIFGFVNFMDELIKSCDCAVIKAGAATLIEVLKTKKPVIICSYIHGQELGNVQFIINNDIGWFIQKPEQIYKKAEHLFSDPAYYESVRTKLDTLNLNTDASALARRIWEAGAPANT